MSSGLPIQFQYSLNLYCGILTTLRKYRRIRKKNSNHWERQMSRGHVFKECAWKEKSKKAGANKYYHFHERMPMVSIDVICCSFRRKCRLFICSSERFTDCGSIRCRKKLHVWVGMNGMFGWIYTNEWHFCTHRYSSRHLSLCHMFTINSVSWYENIRRK